MLTDCASAGEAKKAMRSQRLNIVTNIGLGARSDVVVHHNVVSLYTRCNIIRDIHRERDWRLGSQRLVEIAVCDPDYLAAGIVKGCQHLRDVRCLPALVDQSSLQDLSAQRVLVDSLVFNSDDRIGTGRNEEGANIHSHTLYLA